MKHLAKILALALALMMLCTAAFAEHATLTFIVPSNTSSPNGFDKVLEAFKAQTGETLDDSLNFIFTGFDDIGQKVSLRLSSGEPMDSVFAAQWTSPSLNEMALKGQLVNLDSYFDNDDYPGLKAAFSSDYLIANSFVGPDGEYHVYGIPFSQTYAGGGLFYYRNDLADKYGITIENEEDIIAYWDAVLENEPGMIPFAFLGNTNPLTGIVSDMYSTPVTKHNTANDGNNNLIILDDGTAYYARSVIPALDETYRSALDDADPSKEDPLWACRIAQEWMDKGYVDPDCMNVNDIQAQFIAGKAASFLRGADTFESIRNQLEASLPDAELGFIIFDRNTRNQELHQTGVTFQAWNFACIPVTCMDPDRVMKFYDWLFSDRANHDLFEYGVEGEHWIAEGEDQYSVIHDENGNVYNFDAFVLTWLPSMTRYAVSTPEEVVEYMKQLADPNTFYRDVNSGFSFVDEAVSSEAAKLSSLDDLAMVVMNGLAGDIEASIAEVDKKRENAGLEKYAEEYVRQFNEFLKEHPYEGQ